MDELTIKIVGNGGCLNNGLPYNAFLINGHVLVESPPDVMLSLQSLGIDWGAIDTVFISHLHGDHTFGLPFFIINKWMKTYLGAAPSHLTIYGPEGIGRYTRNLTEAAFTTAHPCYEWLEANAAFETIKPGFDTDWNGLSWACFPLEHMVETYGFSLKAGGNPVFTYVADTRWCSQVERVLGEKPKVVLMDMNGGEGNVHISVDEVVEKGLPLTGTGTVFYGTHLADEFDSPAPNVQCAFPGDEIVIDCQPG